MNSDDDIGRGQARVDALFAELAERARAPLPEEPFVSGVRRGIVRGARYRAILMSVAIGAALVIVMPVLIQFASNLQPLLGQVVDLPGWQPQAWAALLADLPTYLWGVLLGALLTAGALALDR
jgi:hypothetical protein